VGWPSDGWRGGGLRDDEAIGHAMRGLNITNEFATVSA
jgi:hypothetical protein